MQGTIKQINTRTYVLELYEGEPNVYYVHWEHDKETFTSRGMTDLKTAFIIFDDLLAMLEGN